MNNCTPESFGKAIVPALNLPGVPKGKLHLTGPLFAAILTGKVRQWNDDAIGAVNPGIHLPAEAIRVVARQDGSGSTWVLSKCLSVVSTAWAQEMGNDSVLHWPTTTLLARGSSGMADLLKQTPYSIGYLEPGYIASSPLNYALVAKKEFVCGIQGATAAPSLPAPAWASTHASTSAVGRKA